MKKSVAVLGELLDQDRVKSCFGIVFDTRKLGFIFVKPFNLRVISLHAIRLEVKMSKASKASCADVSAAQYYAFTPSF